jgi:hypothetical protein
MLYDFHKWQNDKRPNTLHATYVIYGIKKKPEQQDGDVEMTDSQMSDDIHAPFSDLVPTYTLSLVNQERLQGEPDGFLTLLETMIDTCQRFSGTIQRSYFHSCLQLGTASS